MRERYLIFILGMILISFLFFWTSCNSMQKSTKQIESYDKKIKATMEKLNNAMLMGEQLESFTKFKDNSLTAQDNFTIDELNEFKIIIDDLRERNQLKLIKISDTSKSTEAGKIENTYNLEMDGTYQQMGRFLAELERQDYVMKIQYLDVSPSQLSGKEEQSTNQINRYRITMEISILKVKKETKDAD